jgi:hypothetical protein
MAVHSENRKHRAVKVCVGRMREEIDERIAPLVREIWKAGIRTIMSCQETEPGIAWIEFDSVADLIRFLNVVAQYEEGVDTLYNRINRRRVGPTSTSCWEFQLNLLDCGFSPQDDDRYEGPADFLVSVGVYFPQGDLPVLVRRMKHHNSAVKAGRRKCPRGLR